MLTTHVESLFDMLQYEHQENFISFLSKHEKVKRVEDSNFNGTTIEVGDILFNSNFWNVVITEFLDSNYER